MKVYFITKSVAKNIYFESTPLHTCTLSMKNPTPCRISENAKRRGPRGFGGRRRRTLPVQRHSKRGERGPRDGLAPHSVSHPRQFNTHTQRHHPPLLCTKQLELNIEGKLASINKLITDNMPSLCRYKRIHKPFYLMCRYEENIASASCDSFTVLFCRSQ